MITRDQLVLIGRYNKPHGVQGEINATLDVAADLLPGFGCLVSDVDGIFVPFFVASCRTKTASSLLLTLEGIDSEREVAKLVNHDIYVLKTEFDALAHDNECDEFPLDYFIGFRVVDDGEPVGVIVDVDDATDNVLFVVEQPDGNLVRVPAVDDLITDIDEDNQTLLMQLPVGLLDL
ncbi:MAG: 16S rRNA processing protein RimM [Muribaculaceae bacterium]|nr:16S rRNA processing protein RimM [Muribaculaceae bacterium]